MEHSRRVNDNKLAPTWKRSSAGHIQGAAKSEPRRKLQFLGSGCRLASILLRKYFLRLFSTSVCINLTNSRNSDNVYRNQHTAVGLYGKYDIK